MLFFFLTSFGENPLCCLLLIHFIPRPYDQRDLSCIVYQSKSFGIMSDSIDIKQVKKKKSVLAMAANFEQTSAAASTSPPSTRTPTPSTRRNRPLTTSSPSPSPESSQSDEPEQPLPKQRAPVIIPKTYSDMKKAGETMPSPSSSTTTRHFKSLKLSRFNEFMEQKYDQPEAKPASADVFDEYPGSDTVNSDTTEPLQIPQIPAITTPSSPRSPSHFITRSVSSSSNTPVTNTESFDDVSSINEDSITTTYEAPTNLPSMHTHRPSSASHSSVSSRTPSFTLKPIIKEEPVPEEDENIIFAVCVVGFHHIRGPEVEFWRGVDGDQSKLWPNLPFQALPDGSHSHEENFCYFTMLYDQLNHTAPLSVPTRDKAGNIIEDVSDMENVTTLFGISCNRQIKSSELKSKPADVTRSTVQKSIIVIARKPIFGPIREKLAVITRAFFLQADFSDMSIIDNLYVNLRQLFSTKVDENDMYVGMSLRELIYRLRSKVLILLKALLLETKILFFANNTEVLCSSQFSLVSLIPALMDHLDSCGSPLLDKYEKTIKKPTSLRTSDRKSLLTFMGLPLQPFGEGGIFNPYVPLQQFNELKAPETKFFLVGSTNSLLLSPQNKIADIVVHMDHDTVEIANNSLNSALTLSSSDKKWMEFVVSSVVDTWDPEDPWRPKGLGFHGSEDFVRQQFEDYIMGLLSSVKYDEFLSRYSNNPSKNLLLREVEGNPVKLFHQSWVQEWRTTNNFRIFSKITDDEIFDIVEPRHMASTLGVNNNNILQRKVNELEAPAAAAATRVAKAWENFWWGGEQEMKESKHSEEDFQEEVVLDSNTSKKTDTNEDDGAKARSRAATVSSGKSVGTTSQHQHQGKGLFNSWWGS